MANYSVLVTSGSTDVTNRAPIPMIYVKDEPFIIASGDVLDLASSVVLFLDSSTISTVLVVNI